jgi:hypothetical protein
VGSAPDDAEPRGHAVVFAEAAAELGRPISWLLDLAATGQIEVWAAATFQPGHWWREAREEDVPTNLLTIFRVDQEQTRLDLWRMGDLCALPPGPFPGLRRLAHAGRSVRCRTFYLPSTIDPDRRIYALSQEDAELFLESLWLPTFELNRLMPKARSGPSSNQAAGTVATKPAPAIERPPPVPRATLGPRALTHVESEVLAEAVRALAESDDNWHTTGPSNGRPNRYQLAKLTGHPRRNFGSDKPLGAALECELDAAWMARRGTSRPK